MARRDQALVRRVRRAVLRSPVTRAVLPRARRHRVAYDPALVPPPHLMRTEQIHVLEEWFRWGDDWCTLLRTHGGLRPDSAVLELGCGLGRVATPLRHLLGPGGSYDGFDIVPEKIAFLRRAFGERYPHFRVQLADIRNTRYNPGGAIDSASYTFPYGDGSFDLVYAASLFTHLLPEGAARYFHETARVMKPDARAVFSFLLLDLYEPGRPRPFAVGGDFDHPYPPYADGCAFTNPANPEGTTAYRVSLIERLARQAGLALVGEPLVGAWSGTSHRWFLAQDAVVLRRA